MSHSQKNSERYNHKCTLVFIWSALYLSQALMKLGFSWWIFSKNTQTSHWMKICPVGAELFVADRRTDEQTDRPRLTTLLPPRSKLKPEVVNLLKPTGYVMHQQFLTFNNCRLCPHCIYVFCIYLRTNSDLCHLQHKLIGFYKRDEKCLQRGTDWVFE